MLLRSHQGIGGLVVPCYGCGDRSMAAGNSIEMDLVFVKVLRTFEKNIYSVSPLGTITVN